MPYRSLKHADLKPLTESNLRTVPQTALVLMVAAQVIVWGMLIVACFIFLRPFQTAVEAYEMPLSTSTAFLVQSAEFVREQVGWMLVALVVFLGVEVFYFVRHRPFTIRRITWLTLMCFSLLLPFFFMLIAGMLLLQSWAELLKSLS
jgi:hypothetical protein